MLLIKMHKIEAYYKLKYQSQHNVIKVLPQVKYKHGRKNIMYINFRTFLKYLPVNDFPSNKKKRKP